jgi:hypothetical protein
VKLRSGRRIVIAATFMASVAVAAYLALHGGFTLFGDSYTYFRYADLLARGEFQPDLYVRTAGYPILLVLTGYTITHSLVGPLIVQALFAGVMPLLVYKTFAPFGLWIGIVAAAVCLSSLTPVFFQNTFYPDAAYLFFTFAAVYCITRFAVSRKPQFIYWCFASLAFAFFLRPAAIALLVTFTILLVLWYRRYAPYVFVSAIAVVASTFAFGQIENWTFSRQNSTSVARSMVGRQLFLNAYLRSAPFGGFEVSGNTFRDVNNELISFFSYDSTRGDPPSWGHQLSPQARYELYGRYEKAPSALVARMFKRPEFLYYWMLFSFGDRSPDGDRQFLILWLKYLEQRPALVARYVFENYGDLAVGQCWTYVGGVYPANKAVQTSSVFWPITSNISNEGPMPPAVIDFLNKRGPARGRFSAFLSRVWTFAYAGRPILLALMILGWFVSLREASDLRFVMTVVLVTYAANTFLLSLLVDPDFRYQLQGMALSAFSAGAAVVILSRSIMRVISSARPNQRYG